MKKIQHFILGLFCLATVAFAKYATIGPAEPLVYISGTNLIYTAPNADITFLSYEPKDRQGNRTAITIGNRATGKIGPYSTVIGDKSAATAPYSIAAGGNSLSSHDYSFTWSGITNGTPYYSHGNGTFNINAVGGTSGIWIGDTTLDDLITAAAEAGVLTVNGNDGFVTITNGNHNVVISTVKGKDRKSTISITANAVSSLNGETNKHMKIVAGDHVSINHVKGSTDIEVENIGVTTLDGFTKEVQIIPGTNTEIIDDNNQIQINAHAVPSVNNISNKPITIKGSKHVKIDGTTDMTIINNGVTTLNGMTNDVTFIDGTNTVVTLTEPNKIQIDAYVVPSLNGVNNQAMTITGSDYISVTPNGNPNIGITNTGVTEVEALRGNIDVEGNKYIEISTQDNKKLWIKFKTNEFVLNDIHNVVAENPSDLQALLFDDVEKVWKPVTLGTLTITKNGGDGQTFSVTNSEDQTINLVIPTDLDSIDDVVIDLESLENNQYLVYDNGSWKNISPPAFVASVNGLTNAVTLAVDSPGLSMNKTGNNITFTNTGVTSLSINEPTNKLTNGINLSGAGSVSVSNDGNDVTIYANPYIGVTSVNDLDGDVSIKGSEKISVEKTKDAEDKTNIVVSLKSISLNDLSDVTLADNPNANEVLQFDGEKWTNKVVASWNSDGVNRGTKLGTLTINESESDLYAPTNSWTQFWNDDDGNKMEIGTLSFDNGTTMSKIYIPTNVSAFANDAEYVSSNAIPITISSDVTEVPVATITINGTTNTVYIPDDYATTNYVHDVHTAVEQDIVILNQANDIDFANSNIQKFVLDENEESSTGTKTLTVPESGADRYGKLTLYLEEMPEDGFWYDIDTDNIDNDYPSKPWTNYTVNSLWKFELESQVGQTAWKFKNVERVMDIVSPEPEWPAKTTFTLSDGTKNVIDISGTLDQQWMIDHGYYAGGSWVKTITKAEIGTNVTTIGSQAFYSCTSLTNVTIPNSVTSIGYNAFFECFVLTSVTIPDSVKSIGEYAFSICESLTSVMIGNSVTNIGDFAFSRCTDLTSITIPDSVTSIGMVAFSECSNLTNLTIPNSVTSIGAAAFRDCSSLSITMSDKTVAAVKAMSKYPWSLPSGCVIHCSNGNITL